MVVWRGKGWLVVLILVGSMYLIPAAWLYLHGERDLPLLWVKHYDRVFASSLIIAGLLLIPIGFTLNRNPDRFLLNPRTGQTVRAGRQHTLYYLAIEWWGAAALCGGMFMYFHLAHPG